MKRDYHNQLWVYPTIIQPLHSRYHLNRKNDDRNILRRLLYCRRQLVIAANHYGLVRILHLNQLFFLPSLHNRCEFLRSSVFHPTIWLTYAKYMDLQSCLPNFHSFLHHLIAPDCCFEGLVILLSIQARCYESRLKMFAAHYLSKMLGVPHDVSQLANGLLCSIKSSILETNTSRYLLKSIFHQKSDALFSYF